MMNLDEAIQHCKEQVQEQAKRGCYSCAEEHQQLAEWLKELKDYRKTWDEIKKQIKEEASFACANFDEYAEEVLDEEDADELDDFRFGMQRALEIINEYVRVVKE